MCLKNNAVILLQSGGRDSAVACVNLLEKGNFVQAITFVTAGKRQIGVPMQRAEEIKAEHQHYAWAAIQYADWENAIKSCLPSALASSLPRSCLVCAVAKVTAVMKLSAHIGVNRIAVGYTEYQNEWAEQTPRAVSVQKELLEERGYELLTPVSSLNSKEQAQAFLTKKQLTPSALENPCCVSRVGTEHVPPALVEEVINRGFEYADTHEPNFPVIAALGDSLI